VKRELSEVVNLVEIYVRFLEISPKQNVVFNNKLYSLLYLRYFLLDNDNSFNF